MSGLVFKREDFAEWCVKLLKGHRLVGFFSAPLVFNYFDEGIARFNAFSLLVFVVCSFVTKLHCLENILYRFLELFLQFFFFLLMRDHFARQGVLFTQVFQANGTDDVKVIAV